MQGQPKSGHLDAFMQAWRQLHASDTKRYPARLEPDAPRFVDYAWKDFQPTKVLDVLTSRVPVYESLRPILFSGLCTYVVCPNRPALRQHGMLIVGIEHLQQAEANGRAMLSQFDIPSKDLIGDIVGRMRFLGYDFYSDFYYPIGGLAQVLRSTTPNQFAKSLKHHSQATRNVIAMMAIYDYHAKHLNNLKLYYPPSEGKGYKLVRIINGEYRSEYGISIELSEKRWKTLCQTAALIYAASTITAQNGTMLIDVICSGQATFEDHGHLLPEWISRAHYAAETVLRNFTKPDIGRANAAMLPPLAAKPTPEPSFSSSEQKCIEAEFDRAQVLSRRRRTERIPKKP